MGSLRRSGFPRGFAVAAALIVLFAIWSPVAAHEAALPEQPRTTRIVVAHDPSPGFLLALAPMLRVWPETQLLVASEGNRAAVEQYLRRFPKAEVWILPMGKAAPPKRDGPCRVVQGEARQALQVLRSECWTHPEAVVLAERADARASMLGCLLAVANRAPLYLLDRNRETAAEAGVEVSAVRRAIFAGKADQWQAFRLPESVERKYAHDPEEILASYVRSLGLEKTDHVVVVNASADALDDKKVPFWSLAVPYALRHRAALALVKDAGELEGQITAQLEKHPSARYVTLFGDGSVLPPPEVRDPAGLPAPAAGSVARAAGERRPGGRPEPAEYAVDPGEPAPSAGRTPPAPEPEGANGGNAKMIAAELLSGVQFRQPCAYRVGRITGDSPATVSLVAANGAPGQKADDPSGCMMANVGEKPLPMLECIARATERSFAAHGWPLATRYGASGPPIPVERLLAADLIIYQGHTANLGEFTKLSQQAAVLPPSLVVLQGCVSLHQSEAMNLLQRGAAGVVGTHANMYSASGGAFTKAMVDAILDGHDAGTSLMIARNYLLALSVMKENREHQESGRPLRAAMTFSLWGDPTWRPAAARKEPPESSRVRAVRRGSRVEVHVPRAAEEIHSGPYLTTNPLDAELAGLYTVKAGEGAEKQLVPLYFTVLPLENWDRGEPPVLSSTLKGSQWISLWDPHNRWLYLLVWGKNQPAGHRGKVFSFDLR